jgi:ABC-type antimicrobial peptide transport system permease subunit
LANSVNLPPDWYRKSDVVGTFSRTLVLNRDILILLLTGSMKEKHMTYVIIGQLVIKIANIAGMKLASYSFYN